MKYRWICRLNKKRLLDLLVFLIVTTCVALMRCNKMTERISVCRVKQLILRMHEQLGNRLAKIFFFLTSKVKMSS